ncbi:alpha/beta hydrolase [Lysobacter sp. 5GHs7-4]|uniref:alpha/beta hydrolase family protein n=1 Tax=Lysobacter sp. 5GHs7-4 TaxID=2904253 RepID=UPI001E2F1849|nr:alpha/beta hydrolase [Lysobacter sp. 5GHs7-4]UHQ22656.1 alpha/beta hydrolase [Lysobacter sp. 5GHs7-4]
MIRPLPPLIQGIALCALLASGSLWPRDASAAEPTDRACIGSYRLSDGRDVDLAVSDESHYRWRMKDGTSGKLSGAARGAWVSTLGWTDRADGHRVDLRDCARGRIAFDRIAGERLKFEVVETSFQAGDATLAGRLVLPAGDDAVPIVVLVHGSERDSARDYYALQRQFPSEGIGAFVYDKRGTGASTGRYTQNFLTLANDAIAALREARRLAGTRAGRMGYQAGSQGGWVAPLAARIEPADFVIVSFGLAVSPLDEDREAIALDMSRRGYGPDVVAKAMEVADATAVVLQSDFREGYDGLAKIKQRYGAEPWFKFVRGNVSFFILEKPEAELRTVGPTLFPGTPLDYDAMPVLRNLRVPQLWLLGGEDIDAPSAETVRRLTGLAQAGAPIRHTVFPHAEHGMYEFEVGADGSRLSTRQPADYFPQMRDFIKSGSVQPR